MCNPLSIFVFLNKQRKRQMGKREKGKEEMGKRTAEEEEGE
jgi:hypothetical protein